jgi:hypothetical protein
MTAALFADTFYWVALGDIISKNITEIRGRPDALKSKVVIRFQKPQLAVLIRREDALDYLPATRVAEVQSQGQGSIHLVIGAGVEQRSQSRGPI